MPAWLDRLEEYERSGFREAPGVDSNPVIMKWAHGVGPADYMTDDGTTPWCGIGLAGIMEECGLKHVVPKGPAAASAGLSAANRASHVSAPSPSSHAKAAATTSR
jgi:hypothetical protein